jgi:uncharacterized protein (DUF169 family)
MTDNRIAELLSQAIAIGYFAEPPEGVPAYAGEAVPAGCSFWQLARQGRSFYTSQADHYNCAVGAHTHGIALPPERQGELANTIGFMVSAGYLRLEEVPAIPTLKQAPRFIACGPAGDPGFQPSIVVVPVRPAQAMLVYEAALRAGIGDMSASVLGRPGCAIEPFTLASGKLAFSFGCIGNRSFSGLAHDEMYVSIPGDHWLELVAALEEVAQANEKMAAHYQDQATKFGPA